LRKSTTTSATGFISIRSTAGAPATSRIPSLAAARSRPAPPGSASFAERLLEASREAEPAKLRAKPAKFAEHYAQAALFFNSQSPIEQQHIIDGFRFELTRVQTEAVRERVVAQLRNVDEGLALAVANGLGMALPEPLRWSCHCPRWRSRAPQACRCWRGQASHRLRRAASPSLSLMAWTPGLLRRSTTS